MTEPFRPTEEDGRRALMDHAVERAHAARQKYGRITADTILQVLEDRTLVRYPVHVRFDASGLRRGEFAHAEPLGDHPSAGFCLFVHPALEARPEAWPLAVAYHLPAINYGDIASPEDCEAFGAALSALPVEAYYQALCRLADELA